MMLLGMFGKFGAVVAMIPDPVIGGTIHITLAIVASVGLSYVQFCDMNSTRNLIVLGLSMYTALMMPEWVHNNPEATKTGKHEAPHGK